MPNLPSLATCCVSLELRPLPSIGVNRLRRYYWPLRRLLGPACPSRDSGWSCDRPPRQSVPCCISLPLLCMPSSLPRRNSWVRTSLTSPEAAAFPEIQAGRLPHHPFRGLRNVHSHYGLHIRQVTQGDPLHRRLQPPHSLGDCSDCYRLERQLPGGLRTHWKTVPLHGALNKAG